MANKMLYHVVCYYVMKWVFVYVYKFFLSLNIVDWLAFSVTMPQSKEWKLTFCELDTTKEIMM